MTQLPTPSSADAAELAGAALRTFFNIQSAWGISNADAMTLLGLSSKSTYFKWKKEPASAKLAPDTLERLSYIFGIYKSLQILLPNPQAADSWITRPNTAPPFGGQSALARMLSGRVADLYVVRQYLDAERGWG